jgi:phosphate:Na+ symporter
MDGETLASAILLLIGGLGTFLVGMKLLQDSTEKLANGGLRKLFAKTAKNPFVGVGVGTLATMLLQSSGATTVMVVGFVNAGAMNLAQATTYIMGANIGTTITAQIVALGNLPVSEVMIALTLLGIATYMAVSKKHEKVGSVGILVAGLGLLFLGLELMTVELKALFDAYPAFSDFLKNLTNPFLLLLIGIVSTALVQSSSAITSIVIAMAMAGVVVGGGGNGVLYLILGTNIGSTSTALLSAIGSTKNGKRAAFIHFLFNFLGSALFFVILICIPQFNEVTFAKWFANSPQEQIAMFHTFFNVVCTLLFLPLTKVFVKIATWVIPDKKPAEGSVDSMLDERFLETPVIATSQSVAYYHKMAEEALNSLNLSIDAFLDRDEGKEPLIHKSEERVMEMSRKLTDFNVRILGAGVPAAENERLSKMELDIADLVRLSEVADNITGYTRRSSKDSLTFSPIVYDQIRDMKKLLNEQYAIADAIVEKPSLELLETARRKEDEIDAQRTAMVQGHMERLNKGSCPSKNSDTFINLVGNLERCGDHFNFICERACEGLSASLSMHA